MSDGDRTHDHWSHNPALYRLSYTHHNGRKDAKAGLEAASTERQSNIIQRMRQLIRSAVSAARRSHPQINPPGSAGKLIYLLISYQPIRRSPAMV